MITRPIKDGHMVAGLNQLKWHGDRDVVPDWLNAAIGTESYARVEALMEDILSVEATMETHFREGWFINHPSRPRSVSAERKLEELDERCDRIHEALSRYSFVPELAAVMLSKQWVLWMRSELKVGEYAHRYVVDGKPIPNSTSLFHAEQTVGEADVVLRIANLAVISELHRVKRCANCGKWFYAERSHQKFCPGAECRFAHYRRSPQYKNYRKDYMRKRRAKQTPPNTAKTHAKRR
jgi:hypothetical protein